jgi:hypothetical protein
MIELFNLCIFDYQRNEYENRVIGLKKKVGILTTNKGFGEENIN